MLISEDRTTRDVAAAEESIGRMYRRVRIRNNAFPFTLRQRVVGDERANFTRLEIDARTEMDLDLDDVVGIGHVRAGSYHATSNGREVNPSEAFLLAPGTTTSRSEGLDLLLVNLDLPQLARHSGIERGAARLRYQFSDFAPSTPSAALQWRATVEYCQGVLDDPVLLSHDLIRRAAIDAVFAVAVTAFQISFPLIARESDRTALPSAVRRAQSFIEDNAALPISVIDVAEASRLSVRGLQAAFQRTLDTTPQAYIRKVRMDAARAELLEADPGDEKVGDIARRWGFHHLSRFAHQYRAEFGESPSTTLHH